MSSRKELFLLGKNLSHSFSKQFFESKFKNNPSFNNWTYNFYEINNVEQFNLLKLNPNFLGCNVTIPFKSEIISCLDEVDSQARKIGAVNTVVKETQNNKSVFKGYNTDANAFLTTLSSFTSFKKALVLGNGGASKAVQYVLKELNINYILISRNIENNFDNFQKSWIKEADLVINCTPLGMFPHDETCPPIPYQLLNAKHTLYDLVYNPEETVFLKKGKMQDCTTKNGLEMLYLQAEMALKLFVQAAKI